MGDRARIKCVKFNDLLKLIVSRYIIRNGLITETMYLCYTHLLGFGASKLQPGNNLGLMSGFPFYTNME